MIEYILPPERLEVARELPQELHNILPPGKMLFQHQIDTYNYLRDNNATVVINISPTGSGKTLAASLPLLTYLKNTKCLIITPLNILVNQLYDDIIAFKEENNLNWLNPFPLTAVNKAEKNETINQIIEDYNIIITNPDYFGLMWTGGEDNTLAKHLEYLIGKIEYLVIDEFHNYTDRQFARFIGFLTVLKETGWINKKHMLLLSATPSPYLQQMLENLSLLHIPVNWITNNPGNEQILEEVKLRVTNEGLMEVISKEMDWIRSNLKQGKRGAIITDSIQVARKIYYFLLKNFTELQIGLIDGLRTGTSRKQEFLKPLLICSPVLDLGFNFKSTNSVINILQFGFFDGNTINKFLQRVGRFGRSKVHISSITNLSCEVYYCNPSLPLQKINVSKINPITRKEIAQLLLDQYDDLNKPYLATFGLIHALLPIGKNSNNLQKYAPVLGALFQSNKEHIKLFEGIVEQMNLFQLKSKSIEDIYKQKLFQWFLNLRAIPEEFEVLTKDPLSNGEWKTYNLFRLNKLYNGTLVSWEDYKSVHQLQLKDLPSDIRKHISFKQQQNLPVFVYDIPVNSTLRNDTSYYNLSPVNPDEITEDTLQSIEFRVSNNLELKLFNKDHPIIPAIFFKDSKILDPSTLLLLKDHLKNKLDIITSSYKQPKQFSLVALGFTIFEDALYTTAALMRPDLCK